MKVCSKCGLEKPFGEFGNKTSSKDGLQTKCKDCEKEYYRTNAEAIKKRNAAYNRDRMADYMKDWQRANGAKANSNTRKWKRENTPRILALNAKRRAAKLSATPAWANEEAISQYYLISSYLSEQLGVAFSVDHVVPLQSDLVCGFHAETNLSISLGVWNSAKGNRYWPDMAEQL